MKIDPSNFEECIARVAARGKMTAGEAQQLLGQVADRAEKMRATGIADPYVAAARDLVDRVRDEAKNNAADAILNARLRDDKFGYVAKDWTAGKINGPEAGKRTAGLIRSLFYWQPGAVRGENVQTLWHANLRNWGGLLLGKLRAEGLLDAAKAPEMLQPIAEEIEAIRNKTPSTRGANDPARRIAEIWSPIAEDIRARQNSVGARIADAHDFVAHTSHDPILMRGGGRGSVGFRSPTPELDVAFQRWWDTIAPLLNEDKTFADVGDDQAARQKFARSAFEAITTAVRKRGRLSEGEYAPPEYEGAHNLARKLSQGRVFFFKDASSWSRYMAVYGRQTSFGELMNDTIRSGARNYAMMRVLGTNPAGNLAAIIRRINEEFRPDVDGVNAFKQALEPSLSQPGVDNVMATLDGSANIPVNQWYYKIGSSLRMFYDTIYLGAVGVTHLSAAPMTFGTEARYYNPSTFGRVAHFFHALMPESLQAADRAKMLDAAGAYADGISRDLFDPYGLGFNVPGMISDYHSKFLSMTGLPWLISHFKAGFSEMAMNVLAGQMDKDFDGIEPHVRNTLAKYGIGPQEWGLIRRVEPMKLQSGRVYLTPKNAMDADAAGVESLLRARGEIAKDATPDIVSRKVSAFQQELGDRLMMWLSDGADHSVVTPGVREQALWRGGTQPGSLQRELLASIVQYKTWPLAALHQVLGREIWESLGTDTSKGALWNAAKRDAMGGIGIVIALSVLGGYMRMTIRDLAYGQQPRVPRNLGDATKIGLAALAQGGGLGIFGDFLFGQMNRFGVSNFSSFGGPVATDLMELYGIFQKWGQSLGTDSKHDFWPDLARWGLHHVPFQNLIWFKGALDYMLMYHVYEAMSPGWWERMNRRELKEQGRTMQGYRPGAGVPYGIPGIYLQNPGGETSGLFGSGR